MMVYSAGNGVHAFTLDPRIGEFLLSHQQFQTPPTGMFYSINESNFDRWTEGYREVVREFKGRKGPSRWHKNARYIGSLVADFHRNLLKGGVFMYPGDRKNPRGKLRLLYECSPLAFIAEAAGGAASDGRTPILDIEPSELHQRVPLLIGSREDVAFIEQTLSRVDS
jgi:fructose-1,6-bisphosphatase I